MTVQEQFLYDEDLDEEQLLQKFVLIGDTERFEMVLKKALDDGTCSQTVLDRCLFIAATSEKKGDFCDMLRKAGGNEQFYLDGRLSRAAAKGSVEKIEKWRKMGGDIHHTNDMPLRAAIFNMQAETATHLVNLGAEFTQAVKLDNVKDIIVLPKGKEILKFLMELRTRLITPTLDC